MMLIKFFLSFLLLVLLNASSAAQTDNQSHQMENDSVKHFELKEVDVYGKQIQRRNNVYKYSPLKSRTIVSLSGEADVIRISGRYPAYRRAWKAVQVIL